MMKYIAIGALVALLGVSGALWWQSGRVSALKADNDRLTRNAEVLNDQIEQARLSASVAAAYADRERRLNADANATIEAIRNLKLGECADAPLDPTLADLIGRGNVQSED
ncbi:hypothetical protein [Roseobacter sp. N2S]|uniref:hypothetical protein n=1 Tax=Roseobacter sp. N2S TaxID=2663844 RepID=UPI00285EEEF7|nr:hypothetical protein [Roseobacter sp. N2S]MDR6266530.1 Tfp pilus assembly protein PilX [Roseobacter sp. N2S]